MSGGREAWEEVGILLGRDNGGQSVRKVGGLCNALGRNARAWWPVGCIQ